MALLQIRVEKGIKEKATAIVEESKIDISTAVRLFLLMVVQQKKIPFTINADNEYETYRGNIEYLLDCIDFNEFSPMTFQEIDAIISEIRAERREREENEQRNKIDGSNK